MNIGAYAKHIWYLTIRTAPGTSWSQANDKHNNAQLDTWKILKPLMVAHSNDMYES